MTRPATTTFVRASQPDESKWFDTAQDRMRVQAGEALSYAEWRTGIGEYRELVSVELMAESEESWTGTPIVRSVEVDTGPYRKMTHNTRPPAVAGSVNRTGTVSGGGNRRLSWDVTADYEAALLDDRRIGFRFDSDSTTKQWLVTASLRLEVTTRPRPTYPTNVEPSGVVGTAKPVFTWLAPRGVTQVQVQVDEAGGDFTTPVWDSGALVQTVPRVDSATGPAWAGLSGTMAARVRHFTSSGWSPWAQVSLTYSPPTNFVVSNPAASDADNTPPSVWSPAAQAVRIISFRDGKRVHDTGMIPGPISSYTPPKGARKPGQVLRRVHHLFDGEQRTQPAFVRRVTETVWTPTATVAGLSTFTAAQVGETPAVAASWSRTAGVPDKVSLHRDGELVEKVDGPAGSHVDWTVPPNTDVAYGARAVVNGDNSDAILTQVLRTRVTGVWLVDPVTERGCVLAGLGIEIGMGGEVVVHTPIDGAVLLRRTLTRRGPEGTMAGRITDWPGRTRAQQREDVEWLAERPERVLRLILGDLNVPVTVSGLQALFDVEHFFADRGDEHNVSFAFSAAE